MLASRLDASAGRPPLRAATAIALIALTLTVAGCARRADVDADFCARSAEQWNSFADRAPDADVSAARDEVLDFWEDSRDPDVVNDTVDEVLLSAERDLRQALSERGLQRENAITDLENALGVIAQECTLSGHPITYTPAAQAFD